MPCSRTQRSDADDTRTRDPWLSSRALHHLATALPYKFSSEYLSRIFCAFHARLLIASLQAGTFVGTKAACADQEAGGAGGPDPPGKSKKYRAS